MHSTDVSGCGDCLNTICIELVLHEHNTSCYLLCWCSASQEHCSGCSAFCCQTNSIQKIVDKIEIALLMFHSYKA